MARKSSPNRKTTTRSKRQIKPYRQSGFHSEQAYKNWVKRWSKIPQSDPRWFDPTMRGQRRTNEILRLKKIIKKTRTPAKEIYRKVNLLVFQLSKMSGYAAKERYAEQIRALLADPDTTAYEKRMLRKLLRNLDNAERVLEDMEPGEQGELF